MRTKLFTKCAIALGMALCLTGCPKPDSADTANKEASQQSRLAQMLGFGKAAPAPSTTAATTPSEHLPMVNLDQRATALANIPPDATSLDNTLAKAGTKTDQGTDTFDFDTFAYTVRNGVKTKDGYPIYVLECDRETNNCVGEAGQAIGSIDEVAAKMTIIRNADVVAAGYKCDKICWDPDGNVVGSISPVMALWVSHHPSIHN